MIHKFNQQKLPLWIGFFIALIALASCDKINVHPKPWNNHTKQKTIVEVVVADARFSLLKTAVVRAGLVDALNDKKANLTVFAPTDEAFKAAGFASAADIEKAPVEALKAILLYHVIGDEVFANEIPQAANTAVNALNNQPLYITRTAGSKVFVNGVKVIMADVDCLNGVIHVINRVLIPAPGNLVKLAQSNANLSLLVAAVLRASQGATNVAAVLSSDGPFTVFAPTNEAFAAIGLGTVEAINKYDCNALANILTYHVIGARVFSSDLVDGSKPATLQKGTVTISLAGGATVKGKSNTSASKIIATDLLATNGVAHVINQVLLP
jgi:uncharacterized surface protein with fasciclin (FAS1) repeats